MVAAAPFIYGQVMLSAQQNVTGAVVRGVTPASEAVIDLQRHLKEGEVGELGKLHDVPLDDGKNGTVELPGIIVGKDVARQLGLVIGDPVNVISPIATPTAVGMVPRVKRFVVVGRFDSGMAEYDASLVYMDLANAQHFFDLDDAVTGIEVRVARRLPRQGGGGPDLRRLGLSVSGARLDGGESQPVLGPEVGEDGLLHRPAAHRAGGRVQHRGDA